MLALAHLLCMSSARRCFVAQIGQTVSRLSPSVVQRVSEWIRVCYMNRTCTQGHGACVSEFATLYADYLGFVWWGEMSTKAHKLPRINDRGGSSPMVASVVAAH